MALEGIFPICTHHRSIGVHFGPEIAEYNQRLGFAEVFEGDPCFCAGLGAEVFVFRQLVETNEFWAIECLAINLSDPLDADESVGPVVLDGALNAWVHGELFCREELFTLDAAVDNPLVQETLASSICNGNWFEVVVVLERRVEVSVPIELVDDEVDVLMLFLGHVFDQEVPWYRATFHEVLVHPKNVTTPLRFVGAERSWGVEDARGDEPSGAWLQSVGPREIEDSVVALVPVFDAAPDLFPCGPGFEAHERVGKIIADVVVLRREVVRLGFTFLPHEFCLFGILVHVVGDGAHVVEELRVHRPLVVLAPDGVPDEICATFGNGLLQGKSVSPDNDVRQSLIGRTVIVGGGSG